MKKQNLYSLPQKNKLNKPKRAKIHYIIIMLLSVVSLYFFIQSPFFEIKKIYVKGTNHLTINQVLELANIQPGINILKVNSSKIKEGLSAHPWIKDVQVERKLPSTVNVYIQEREGVAIVPSVGGYLVVDETGVVLKSMEHLGQLVLPVITNVNLEENLPYGEKIKNKQTKDVLGIINQLPEVVHARVAEIAVAEGITFFAMGGLEIRLGTVEHIDKKLQILSDIFNNTDESVLKKIIYIDLRFNGPPIIKYGI